MTGVRHFIQFMENVKQDLKIMYYSIIESTFILDQCTILTTDSQI